MKNKTIKKNNNPRNITSKHNKKTKKKTNKKDKSNILKKSKKINRKNKKLLIGGAYGKYNENFYSLDLTNFERPIPEKDVFSYEFMEKYIGNLNPETKILNEFVYNRYREYRNDYKTKDKSNTKNQDLKEIRLNYYLKSVMSIMKNESVPFKHSQITFENKPIYLYNEVNGIKNNYNTNLKSKLEEKDKKNTYYIDSHGSYVEENIKLYTVPDNIIIHFLTPLNYLAVTNINIVEDQGKEFNISKDQDEKFKILKSQLSDTNSIAENISDLLKINCFKDMITFLPGQKCFDINLSINTNEDIMGIYKINKETNIRKYENFRSLLSEIIESDDIEKSKDITTIYIDCCRSCNNNIDNLTIETMYIYENFIKQLNNSLLNIEEPIEIKKVCENSYTSKIRLKAPINLEAGQNLRLTSKQNKTNEERINKIIKFYKNEYKTDDDTKNFKSTIKDEFSDVEIDVLLYYILGGDKSFDIINFIYLNIDDVNNKELFIKKIYINSLKIIKNEYYNFKKLFNYLFSTYIDILVNVETTIILETPLQVISIMGYTEIAKLLLKREDIDVNIQNKNDNTPLHIALINEYPEIAELLLKHKDIKVNIQNKDNNTPLHIALTNGYTDIVKLLLKREDINVNIQNEYSNSPLHIALINGYTNIAELLLEHKDIMVNIQNEYSNSPLHIASMKDYDEIVELLLKHKDIMVNIQTEYSNSPLHIASMKGYDVIAKLLLEHKNIKVNIQNEYDETPLHFASLNGYTNIVELLLARPKINVNLGNNTRSTPLHFALLKGYIDIVELLLEREDIMVNIKNKYDKTPLHFASLKGYTEIVKLLLKHKDIMVNIQDNYKQTPLHTAVFKNNTKIVELLLDVDNINVDLIDKSGKNPLNIALTTRNTKIIKLLSEYRDTYDTMANEFHDKYNKRSNKKGKSKNLKKTKKKTKKKSKK